MGVYPKPLLARMEPSIAAIVAHVEKRAKEPETKGGELVTEAMAAPRRPEKAL
jgi:hypothetical protein